MAISLFIRNFAAEIATRRRKGKSGGGSAALLYIMTAYMTAKRLLPFTVLAAALCLQACTDGSRRAEIEKRRAALRHKQDSTLLASQQDLAVTDSALEAVKAEYETMKAEVEQHKAELKATPEELTALTRLRMKRDSLQTRWDVLGATIKYIKIKQTEQQQKEE